MCALGEGAEELDGVDRDDLAAVAVAEAAAGRAGEMERERHVVDRRPLGDEVLHEATVVLGVEVEAVAERVGDVDAVHPHVAGEADVEQVGDRLLADDGQVEQLAVRDEAGELRASADRLRATSRPTRR